MKYISAVLLALVGVAFCAIILISFESVRPDATTPTIQPVTFVSHPVTICASEVKP